MFDSDLRDAMDPLDRIRTSLACLQAEDRSSWSGAARSERLLALQALSERVDAEVIRCAADWDAVAGWAEDSALGPRSWLASRAEMTDAAAYRLLKSARLVRDHDATAAAAALAAGETSAMHVQVLALAAHQRADAYAADEAMLLAAASTVSKALDELQPPDPAGTGERPRSLAQRRADAFVLMCERARGGDLPDSRPIAGVEAVIDHATLAGHPTAELDALRCEIAGFGPIARVTAERLVCDCALARIVRKGKSEILDLGRRSRVVPRRLRRAIHLRDQHCQYPGCRAPAAWCDVHHLVHWLLGGETSLENCALLCRRHHVACHEGGWKLVRAPDGLVLAA
jgi:Domain of unknown function (DUF222)